MKSEIFGPIGDHRYRDYAADVHASGRHLLDLINDILDLSKVEAGRLELHESRLDISQVTEVCERLMRERARNGGVRLVFDLPSPAPRVWADDVKLKQVLLNLVSNAIKFTPSGGIVTVAAGFDPDGALRLSVADTGIGMRPEEVPLALQPFRQIDNALTRKYSGTGLGLPLAKALIELHGGRLQIDSRPGVGTTVTIVLPARRRASDEAPPRQAAGRA